MEISVLARQALLYGHIIAFALALATILKEDVRFLRAKPIDSASVLASARSVKWLLLALWATGLPMIIMDVGTDVFLLIEKPKLLAKLIVVIVLTLNGILLHLIAFPMITSKPKNPAEAATLAAMLGAVSMASWLYAFFLGAARYVAPYFSIYEFAFLYLLMLAVAVLFAMLVVRGRLERALKLSYPPNIRDDQEYGLSLALLEAEIARLALSDIQRRLRTKHSTPLFLHQTSSSRHSVPQFLNQRSSVAATHKRTAVASDGSILRRRV